MTVNSSTQISDWLKSSTTRLKSSGIDSARLDALLLLCDALDCDKSWILAHDEEAIAPDTLAALDEKIARRLHHEPIAYIRGHVEFYGRKFIVNEHVLVPRPESENVISLLIAYSKLHNLKSIIDIGTGSGCLAITAKLELPQTKVYATDIDDECLAVAKKNSFRLLASVDFAQGNLLGAIPKSVIQNQKSILLANLPYVPEMYSINQAAKHEPKIALFSGLDGLDHYRNLFAQSAALKAQPIAIITESLPSQHHALAALARKHNFVLEKTKGFAQLFVWDA